MLDLISLKTPQRKWASLAWRGEPPGFSRVAAGALDLRWEPQGHDLVVKIFFEKIKLAVSAFCKKKRKEM